MHTQTQSNIIRMPPLACKNSSFRSQCAHKQGLPKVVRRGCQPYVSRTPELPDAPTPILRFAHTTANLTQPPPKPASNFPSCGRIGGSGRLRHADMPTRPRFRSARPRPADRISHRVGISQRSKNRTRWDSPIWFGFVQLLEKYNAPFVATSPRMRASGCSRPGRCR